MKLLADKLLLNAFLALKHGREKEYILHNLKTILINLLNLEEDGMERNLLTMIFVYLSKVNRISEGILRELFNQLPKTIKVMAIQILEKLETKTGTELLDTEVRLIQAKAKVEEAWYMVKVARQEAAEKEKAIEKEVENMIIRLHEKLKADPISISEIVNRPLSFVKKILNEKDNSH